jgi:hypothetical protein
MFSIQDELKCQREALNELSHGNNALAQELVMYHGMILAATFRTVINEYEEKLNRCPTADELIYVTSEKLKENIRNIV